FPLAPIAHHPRQRNAHRTDFLAATTEGRCVALIGVDLAGHLPNASTFCGRCEEVCPVRIPLPRMMRDWREREFERHLSPRTVRAGLAFWSFFAKRPRLYGLATAVAMRVLSLAGARRGRFR